MTGLIFICSLATSVTAFELLDRWLARWRRSRQLQGISAYSGTSSSGPMPTQRDPSAWTAILIHLLPGRFSHGKAGGRRDAVDLLRRAGYPYPTIGEFYAAAIRTFSIFILIAGLSAGLLIATGSDHWMAVMTAVLFVYLGLRWPYARLRAAVRRRKAAFKKSVLSGLALMNALLSAGVGVQEALRRSAGIGGPFSNLLGLLVAQLEVAPFNKAIEVVEAHLPDPEDVEAALFLRAIRDFYNHNRPLLPSIQALQAAVHREMIEATESRAALVRQRSGLFGVLAVMGLVLTIISPFAGVVL